MHMLPIHIQSYINMTNTLEVTDNGVGDIAITKWFITKWLLVGSEFNFDI